MAAKHSVIAKPQAEAIHDGHRVAGWMDCHVASRLAMTVVGIAIVLQYYLLTRDTPFTVRIRTRSPAANEIFLSTS